MRRRKFVEHIGWTGLGIVWAIGENGLFSSSQVKAQSSNKSNGLSFVQISDTHIGYNKPANPDVSKTLNRAIDAINSLPTQPTFVVHTGDITQLSKPEEFDQAKQILSKLKAPLFTIPGEHDTVNDRGKAYYESFNPQGKKEGLQSWDHSGVHFVSLTNVVELGEGGKGTLGQAQLEVLEKDLARYKRNTPIVVFSHIPLYDFYPQWGWATIDSAKALSLLSRFDSVTVLNGHVHQVVEHSEGNIRFISATSTAYPLPTPGTVEKLSAIQLSEKDLLGVLGFRTVEFVDKKKVTINQHSLTG